MKEKEKEKEKEKGHKQRVPGGADR